MAYAAYAAGVMKYTVYMKVTFYFDPACPFSWITSRWLHLVINRRELTVDWQPFSLATKNDELTSTEDKSKHTKTHRASHRVLRVMVAAAEHNAALGDLYTDFGMQHHVFGRQFDDELIAEVLAKHNLPADLLKEADNTELDNHLAECVKSATAVAGEDIGVPAIVFTASNGSKNGFFGPVLQQLPDNDAALRLWDGLSLLATDTSFYELKRSRPSGDPDVGSTARC